MPVYVRSTYAIVYSYAYSLSQVALRNIIISPCVNSALELGLLHTKKATIVLLWLVASVWVMLHVQVKSPQSNTPLPAVAVRDISLSQLSSRTPSSCSAIYIAGRLFNGLTANDRWHRIYRSQQCSLSLGKGLMLAETMARDRRTDASNY